MLNHAKIRLHEEKFRWANGIWDEFNLKIEGLCEHEYKKTPSKLGMYFLITCQKCNSAYREELHNDNK
jgi:hypothetical protein